MAARSTQGQTKAVRKWEGCVTLITTVDIEFKYEIWASCIHKCHFQRYMFSAVEKSNPVVWSNLFL